jgi:ABC-2 type transport system permease protein
MKHFRLIRTFVEASVQEEVAHRANFSISILNSVLALIVGLMSLGIVYEQVDDLHGWDYTSAQAVLGVFLVVGALRGLVMGPSLDSLAGMDGEVWRGEFDFTLLRPVRTQFLVSVRKWRLLALFDLLLGAMVLGTAVSNMKTSLHFTQILSFLLAMTAGLLILYAILLAAASLVFWNPGFMITWVFDSIFQMGRYPVGIYPGWLRLVLTWVIPVGIITTVPAAALTGQLLPGLLAASFVLALISVGAASLLFRTGLRRYASASS